MRQQRDKLTIEEMQKLELESKVREIKRGINLQTNRIGAKKKRHKQALYTLTEIIEIQEEDHSSSRNSDPNPSQRSNNNNNDASSNNNINNAQQQA